MIMFFSWYVFKVGVVAGLVMGLVAMGLNLIKLTTLDLTKYFGALLTGQIAGRTNFIAGFLLHVLASGILANLYMIAMQIFSMSVSWQTAGIVGVVHALISGMILPVFDTLNPCVVQGIMRPMGYLASNYGITGSITFVVEHLFYTGLVFWMFMMAFN